MRLSEKYIAILEQRKTELENYLKENIREIELPEQVAISTRSDDQRSQSVRISCILLGAGALMAIGGMVPGKPLLTIGGFAMAGVGVVSHVKSNRVDQPELQQKAQDYCRITSKVYSALSSLQAHLFEGWDDCTATIKTQIKSDINRLNIQEEVKSRAIQSVLNTSVVEISMLDVSQALGKIEQKGDYSAYQQYLCTFEQGCLKAIQKAFDEQVSIYNNLNAILG